MNKFITAGIGIGLISIITGNVYAASTGPLDCKATYITVRKTEFEKNPREVFSSNQEQALKVFPFGPSSGGMGSTTYEGGLKLYKADLFVMDVSANYTITDGYSIDGRLINPSLQPAMITFDFKSDDNKVLVSSSQLVQWNSTVSQRFVIEGKKEITFNNEPIVGIDVTCQITEPNLQVK